MEVETSPRRNRLIRFLLALYAAHPLVAVVGSLASVVSLVSIPLSIYLYYASIRHPELVYYLSPARAVVVKQGTASRLAVSFDGRPIDQDVTAVQIAIWNRGKEPIRRDAVREPLIIRTVDRIPILEATIRKKSRPVVQLGLNQSRIASGELEVSWDILETGDGGVLQIVYAGGPDVRVQCTGVFVGQPAIHELRYAVGIRSPSEQIRYERSRKWRILLDGACGVMALLAIVRRGTKGGDKRFALVLAIILAVTVAIFYFTSSVPELPFGLD